jgi:hypothetical protein
MESSGLIGITGWGHAILAVPEQRRQRPALWTSAKSAELLFHG